MILIRILLHSPHHNKLKCGVPSNHPELWGYHQIIPNPLQIMLCAVIECAMKSSLYIPKFLISHQVRTGVESTY
jgi:hypothetical protein